MTHEGAPIPLIDPPLQSMTLADGRTLTWQEFGSPEGRPVLYFHGGGSTSDEGGIFHREAVEHGLRLIATNRPGARGSSPAPGRPVRDYADDVRELLEELALETVACLGESNGGLVTMAVAASLPERVTGGAPINPTLPWFDPEARRVSSASAAFAYRLMAWAPRLVAGLADRSAARMHRLQTTDATSDLVGPPPGTEPDVAALHRRLQGERAGRDALLAELRWASTDWGFDYYAIPVPLDFFCGEHDVQAPFARVLAARNPDARFHEFAFGHDGFSHPDARRRIMSVVAGYVERSRESTR